ncbi:MAG: hypothetical protein HC932_02520 [Thermales bacterium]|nr:hypothetical protein [Thermales bacterium]
MMRAMIVTRNFIPPSQEGVDRRYNEKYNDNGFGKTPEEIEKEKNQKKTSDDQTDKDGSQSKENR